MGLDGQASHQLRPGDISACPDPGDDKVVVGHCDGTVVSVSVALTAVSLVVVVATGTPIGNHGAGLRPGHRRRRPNR